MKTWIHFIGRKYYPTIATFEAEARQHGITRRIALKTMERMSFGDRVLLAMQDGKSSRIFGQFTITTVSGITPDFARIAGVTITNQGGAQVDRGCGSYVTGPTYSLPPDRSLADLAQDLDGAKDGSKPMIGGRYQAQSQVRMRNLPFAQGFRPFDYDKWQTALLSYLPVHLGGTAQGAGSSIPRLGMKPSLFYVDSTTGYTEPTIKPTNDFVIMGSAVQAVTGYSKK